MRIRHNMPEAIMFMAWIQHSIATLQAVPELERSSSGTACKVAMLCCAAETKQRTTAEGSSRSKDDAQTT